MKLVVYLAGHIHGDWREDFVDAVEKRGLDFEFVYPQTEHDLSDAIGENILGEQPNAYLRDDASAAVNNFRTNVLMERADIVVALFQDKYRQWNTAMDATTAVNKNKPLIIIRPESVIHGLKELSNKADVTVDTIEQAVDVLDYVTR